jgi:hypothetical protein
MKRFGLGLLMAALLLFVLPLTVGGCNISCACTSTPDPNWTPAPIGTGEAAIYGAKVAGVPAMTAERIVGNEGRTFYRATAPNAIALVDGDSGIVVEVVLEDRMPDSNAVSISEAQAQTAAEAFMARVGMGTEGLTVSVAVTRHAGVAAYDVRWTEIGGVDVPKFEVLVNASTDAAFAYVDLRMQLSVTAPFVGRQKASELAISALGRPDVETASADFTIDFSAGKQASTWTIGLGAAGETGSDGSSGSVLVRVDAFTGVATVEEP